jgi:hypothetical protein
VAPSSPFFCLTNPAQDAIRILSNKKQTTYIVHIFLGNTLVRIFAEANFDEIKRTFREESHFGIFFLFIPPSTLVVPVIPYGMAIMVKSFVEYVSTELAQIRIL